MRVGVVGRAPKQTAGGAWTFLSGLHEAMLRASSTHEFVWFDPDGDRRADRATSRLAKAADKIGRSAQKRLGPMWRSSKLRDGIEKFSGAAHPINTTHAALERFIAHERIDAMWFTSPPGSVVSVPYMTTVWDLGHRVVPYFPELSTTGWGWAARESAYSAALPRASVVLTGTHAGKAEIVQFYGVHTDNVEVVPFFVPVPSVAHDSEHALSDSLSSRHGALEPFLLYPSQFWPHKNHVNLLHALKRLIEIDGAGLQLVLTGSDKGNLSHVESVIQALDLTAHVSLLGFVSRQELDVLYRRALALVFPSFLGPDNIPPLEAFALGCPVVAANVAGAKEQFEDAAILFDPADPDDICRAVLSLRANDAARQTLIAKGTRIAATRTVDGYVARINQILDRLEMVRRCWGRTYIES